LAGERFLVGLLYSRGDARTPRDGRTHMDGGLARASSPARANSENDRENIKPWHILAFPRYCVDLYFYVRVSNGSDIIIV